jgi:hypothetical protein
MSLQPIASVVPIMAIRRRISFRNMGTSMVSEKKLPVRARWQLWSLLFCALGLVSGCYDGDAMLKEAQSTALTTSLAEVDLGEYSTTLRRDPNSGAYTTIELHIFGIVPSSRLSDIKKQIQADNYRVRHEALSAVRSSSRDELTDPKFTALRSRLEEVVNKVLADAPLKGVGFYQLTVR